MANPFAEFYYSPRSEHTKGMSGVQGRNYLADVLSGRVAQQGIADLNALMDRAVQGDANAALELGLNFTPGAINAIKAYHGSPHKFDKFSLDKIGTGEGAQAYGHGLYFAEHPEVAKQYMKSEVAKVGGIADKADDILSAHQGNLDDAITAVRQAISENANGGERVWGDVLKHLEGRKAPSLYTVNLKPNPEDLLDWDKPLSEQSDKVRAAIAKMQSKFIGPTSDSTLGRDLYSKAMWAGDAIPSSVAASDNLRAFGIPGLRYLDQGSRGAGQGTSNFVIFDDQLVDILNRQ